MLAAELGRNVFTSCDLTPDEMYNSMISPHHAKEGYDYPTVQLPHTFFMLAGLMAQICQTEHEWALDFVAVVKGALSRRRINGIASKR